MKQKKPLEMGMNRTGAATAPVLSKELLEGVKEFPPTTPGDDMAIATLHAEYVEQSGVIGTMPPPGTVKQAVKTMMKALKGERATLYVDKLGERLAFERTGTRLYDALITKYDALGSWDGGPSRSELVRIRNEEAEHMMTVARAITKVGADPTAVTPSADVHAVASMGLGQVLNDPRTTLAQCIEAILVAELVDNDCWSNLVALATEMGDEETAAEFTRCLEEEVDHLLHVRRWIGTALQQQLTGKEAAA